MALDVQRNWPVAMAQKPDRIARSGNSSGMLPATEEEETPTLDTTTTDSPEHTSSPIYLPDEILVNILDFTAHLAQSAQSSLAACCLLNRQWYDAAVPYLYAHPYLYGWNFDPFVCTICPSINLHVRKSPLSKLVKTLNMANLVHQSRNSNTARLIGRTKGNLEEFVAPQASFALNCLAALSKCSKLQLLDLSLVSESPPLPQLFKTVAHLDALRTFRLPRSAGFGARQQPDPSSLTWPPHLEDLSLSGGIDGHFLHGLVAFPQTLRSLTIEHCPQAIGPGITNMLETAVRPLRQLRSLKIRHMPRLSSRALNNVLFLLPQLERLSVSVDYITPALFDKAQHQHPCYQHDLSQSDYDEAVAFGHTNNLHFLELTNSGNPGVEDKISPIDLLIAIDEGTLPALRQVRVARTLLWHSSATARDAEALADVLIEASRGDWESGVGVFADKERGRKRDSARVWGKEIKRVWESVAGVWMFDG
ncbi:hypothetical protein LTR08_004003 [Meristemomyces frigidus]|nr:hypothetical protein LTR08_004003 [Meristemomyces frigidus]